MKSILLLNKSSFSSELESLGFSTHCVGVEGEQSPHRYDYWSQRGIQQTYREGDSIFSVLERLPANFEPEIILYHDDSSPFIRVQDLEKLTIPIAFYSVDSHIHANWHSYLSGLFDRVFVAQKDYLPKYSEYNPNAEWLPLWASEVLEPLEPKQIDVCFRGNLDPTQRNERVQFLKEVGKRVDLDTGSGDYRLPFRQSRIVLNEQISNDVNFRVFEAMMAGALLLTPDSGNGLTEIFIPNKHLVTYQRHNVDEVVEKIEYYLDHPDEASGIAYAGREEVCTHHTSIARAKWLTERFLKMDRKQPPSHSAAAFNTLLAWFSKNGDSILPLDPVVRQTMNYLTTACSKGEPCDFNITFCIVEVIQSLRVLRMYEDIRRFAEYIHLNGWGREGIILMLWALIGADAQQIRNMSENFTLSETQYRDMLPILIEKFDMLYQKSYFRGFKEG